MAKYWWLIAVGCVVASQIVAACLFAHYGIERPILRGILWPIPVIRLLLGGSLS